MTPSLEAHSHLQNATATPIAVAGKSLSRGTGYLFDNCAAAYGDASQEDHQLVVKSIRDYLIKVGDEAMGEGSPRSTHRRVGSVASMR